MADERIRDRVRELRIEKGLSHDEVAAAVDVPRQTINSQLQDPRLTPRRSKKSNVPG
jgi:DNA-binding XRE family transcriptional regulator